ncbi:hypothetical protein T552_00803 [Pneumocystis carinii B80]|uniref:Uncharacterized protein n=1 Tax=Pneumocystis carinii (strain B80) TaxID=1408658 RepID=A0A0W4ZPN3_PNEC8|nr:hypothetical protein T552_00803 [Pneumocystis carinii B80]KTW30330.1 hypothetical protein T552_00803 [Pneumocystis carinii B80]
MGLLDDELAHGKLSEDRSLFSIYLNSNCSSNNSQSSDIPNIKQLCGLGESIKELLVKIQKKQNTLQRNFQDLQTKYKKWLLYESEINKKTNQGEISIIESKKSSSNEQDNVFQTSQLSNEYIREETELEQKKLLEQSPPEFFKNIQMPQESLSTVFSNKEYFYDEILKISDPQKLKQFLGVSYFPTVDLSDKLPGEPVNEDFSKVKAPIQISISTYYAYLDSFYRPFSEEDLLFLKDEEEELATYMIPPLGIFSENSWASEDLAGMISSNFSLSSIPYGSPDQLTDEHLFTEEISCGPLLERLLSGMLKEDALDDEQKMEEDEKDTDLYNSCWKIPSIKVDYHNFEERLKKELKYIGILGDDDINWNNREDDEISSNLRSLQSQLRHQCAINSARKSKLRELVKEHLAYQEYSIVLNDLNKQVEQAFLKRSRSIEAKKKRVIGSIGSSDIGAGRIGLSNHIQALLERRKKWVEKVGSIFTPIEKYTRLPMSTIYDDLDNIKTDENIIEGDI